MSRRLALALAAAVLAAAACRRPKYVPYAAERGDLDLQVPYGWSVYYDAQGRDYSAYTFVGPFDPDFFLGLPSLSVRWHGRGRPRRLRDGTTESFASPEEFIERTLREVYGPDHVLEGPVRRVAVSGLEARHFVVVSPAPVPPGYRFGVSARGGERAVLRKHAYVVVPAPSGFYVLVYPATAEGYGRYVDRFNHLVNTLKVRMDGPAP